MLPISMRRALLATGLATPLTFAIDPTGGQQTTYVEIASKPSCTDCSIVLEKVVTLGQKGDSVTSRVVAIGAGVISRHPNGEYYVNAPGSILVYDAAGKLVRQFGQPGRAPGELPSVPSPLLGAGDRVFVGTAGEGLSIFSTAGRYLDRWSIPWIESFLAMNDTLFVVVARAGATRPGDTSLRAVRVVNAKGALLNAFGPISKRDAPVTWGARHVARGPQGTLWVAYGWDPGGDAGKNGYRLEQWSIDGRRLAAFVRHPKTFKQISNAGNLETPAFVHQIFTDSGGLVWVVSMVGNPDFDPNDKDASPIDLGSAPSPGGAQLTLPGPDGVMRFVNSNARAERSADARREFDLFVEIIDPVKRELVYSQRFSTRLFLARSPGGLAFVPRGIGGGNVAIDIKQLRLVHGQKAK